jgi:hypothetical protein
MTPRSVDTQPSEQQRRRRAEQVPVLAEERFVGREPYGYADAFAIRLPEPDMRSAEEFTRCALEEAPWLVRQTVSIAHRYVLRLRLGPRSSPDHVFGWKICTSEPDVVHLEAVSPLLGRGAIVARRPDPTRAVVTTYVFFARPSVGRAVWAVTGPVHRRVVAYLLERVAASTHCVENPVAVR